MNNIYEKIKETFGLSLKSLSFFRVLIAISLISDYINRSFDIKAFYTDSGVLPRNLLFQLTGISQTFSLHLMADGVWFQMLLFTIGIAVAIALLLGYKTRTMTIISWILLVSLQNRNPVVLQGGDVVFRMLLFWAAFLPLGEYWSFDSIKKKAADSIHKIYVFNLASIAMFAQLAFIYTFSILLKTGVEWRIEYTALYYTLSIDQFTKPLGYLMLKFPEFMRFMTLFTFLAELFSPYLLLIPFKNHIFRIITIFVMVGLHVGMGLSMNLGQFWWIMVVIWLIFLPEQFWLYLEHFLRRFNRTSKIEIYFDDKCKICVKGIAVIRRFLFIRNAKFIPINESKDILKLANERNSWIVLRGKEKYMEFKGFTEILRNSLIFNPFVKILELKKLESIERGIYRKFSHSRLEVCKIDQENRKKPSVLWLSLQRTLYVIANVIALYFLLIAFMWNYRTIYRDTYIPDTLDDQARFLKIDQWWAMFAPYPLKDDGWFIVTGTYEKKGDIDLFQNNDPVSYEKPDPVTDTYKNQRWRKYMMNLWSRDHAGYRASYLNYICRENKDRYEGDRLQRVEIIYMRERTLKDGQTASPEKVVLETSSCNY